MSLISVNGKALHAHLCPDCDQLLKTVVPSTSQRLCCPRCGYTIRYGTGSLASCRALALTGLTLYLPANFLPVLEITLSGESRTNTVFSGVAALWHQQLFLVSVLVFLFAILAPLLRMVALFLVLLPLRFYQRGTLKGFGLRVMRFHHALHGWGMMDIFLLAIIVAVVKMQDFADVSVEPGLYCLAVMMLVEMKASHALPKQKLWRRFSAEAFP